MTSSEACWNPAVPPPPVAGAAVGAGLAVGLGVTDGDGLTVGDGEGDGLAEVLGLGLTLGELLGETDAVADERAEDEDEDEGVGSAPEEGLPEHADTVTEARTVKMPQPKTAASLALDLLPATVLRTFMEPPHASGRKRRGP